VRDELLVEVEDVAVGVALAQDRNEPEDVGLLDLPALGIPTEEQYIARYCELTGRDGIPGIDYYRAYTLWRLAAIYQGIIKRVEEGTAANEHAETNPDLVSNIADIAWHYARKHGAPA